MLRLVQWSDRDQVPRFPKKPLHISGTKLLYRVFNKAWDREVHRFPCTKLAKCPARSGDGHLGFQRREQG